MKRLILTAGLALIASGCATPETRIRSALTDAGLAKPVASCMAGRMVDRLSLWQLNKLRGLQTLKVKNAGAVSIDDFVKRTKALQDPEILGVVTSSGLLCAFKG